MGSSPVSLEFCFTFMLKNLNFYKNIYFGFYFVFLSLKNFFFFNKLQFDDFCKINFTVLVYNKYTNFFDYLFLKLISFSYRVNLNSSSVRFFDRLNQLNLRVYDSFFSLKKNSNSNYYFSGLYYFFKALRFWILPIILAVLIIYYFIVLRLLPFNKLVFEFFVLIMFFYWFMSGFTFFIKKYLYAKYTSAIQRFWRRSFMLFWLIETFVFLVFLYLTLNANQEPVYMYDYIQIYKTHLFSWRFFFLKIMPVALILFFGYFLLLNLKWSIFSKNRALVVLITLLIVYIFWLEFYQVFHLLQFYGNLVWVYDLDEHFWNLEVEMRRTRICNHYVMICFLAKFFHIIFILIFWIFFVLRIGELNRIRYPLLSANLQNFLFLYMMSWLFMYPWLKFYLRRYMDYSYYWFFIQTHKIGLKIFFNDLKLYYFSFSFFFENFFYSNNKFSYFNFFYWNSNSILTNNSQFIKHSIRDKIINLFYINSIV